jgi:hypothetical protein
MDINHLVERSRALVQIVAALSIIGGGIMFMSEHPYITSRVAKMAGTAALSEELERNNSTLEDVLVKVENIETGQNYSPDPPIKFTVDGNTITDGDVGQLVVFDISYIQEKNCGRPFIIAAFRNGNNIIHTFEDLSIVDMNGRGLTSPASDGQILTRRFTARIPADSGVKHGTAIGWLEFGPWPSCQNAPAIYSPRMTFRIRPGEEDFVPSSDNTKENR